MQLPAPQPSGPLDLRAASPNRAARGRSHHCARYPSGETEATRGEVLCKLTRGCWKPRPPRAAGSPAPRGAQHPSQGAAAWRRSAHTTRTAGRHGWRRGAARLAARGRPTLMTEAQVAAAASGSGSALLTARGDPKRSSAASSPRSREGGAAGRGWGPALAPPVRPGSGGTPPSPPSGPRSWLPGPGSGRAHAHRTGAHPPQRLGRAAWRPGAGWGQADPPLPRFVAPGLGTRPPEPPFPPR